MLDKLDDVLTPERRARLYKLAGAVLVLLIAHGVVSAKDAGDYLTILALALGVSGTAVAHRNVKK